MNNIENIEKLIEKGQKVLATHIPNSPGVIGFPTLDSKAFSPFNCEISYKKSFGRFPESIP